MNIDSLSVPCVLITYIPRTDARSSSVTAEDDFFICGRYIPRGAMRWSIAVANFDRRSTSSSDQPHLRTTFNIVSSCVTIIFSCIWVALHPNIPSPDDSPLRIAIRRAKLMAMALIAPELIVLWAMRQWLVSRRLAAKYRSAFRFLL